MALAPITEPNLSYLLADGKKSQLFLAIPTYRTLFSCQVNQSFSDTSRLAVFIYDNGVGDYHDVKFGATALVGSAAGLGDLGQVRIRKPPTSNTFYIGDNSDIPWADNLYITVINDYSLWQRNIRVLTDGSNTAFMDYDVAYTDQNSVLWPMVRMGTNRVLKLEWDGAANIPQTTTFDCRDSFRYFTSNFIAEGYSAIDTSVDGMITLTYDTAGTYVLECHVQSSEGRDNVGYRYIIVFDQNNPPITQFTPGRMSGDFNSGGWQFSVTMQDEGDITIIPDRSLAILFADDYFGNTKVSMGPYPGAENIIVQGWIDGQTINEDPSSSNLTFDVKGINFWLNAIPSFPIGMEDRRGVKVYDPQFKVWINPTVYPWSWIDTENLTVDTLLMNFAVWRSTLCNVTDVWLTDNTFYASSLDAPLGSLWSQMKTIASKILAVPCCDRYGVLYVEVNQQFLAGNIRNTLPVIKTLNKFDWVGTLDFGRITRSVCSWLYMSGVVYDAAQQMAYPFCSRSGGLAIPKRYGNTQRMDKLVIGSQDQVTLQGGLYIGQLNNMYPQIPITLEANNRLIDIAPRSYLKMNLDPADNVRGITLTDYRIIPRGVSFQFNTGVIQTQLTLEGESGQDIAYAAPCVVPSTDVSVIIPLAIPSYHPNYPWKTGRQTPPPPPVNLAIFLGSGPDRQVYSTLDALSPTPTWTSIGNPLSNSFEPSQMAINSASDKLWVSSKHFSSPQGIWLLDDLVSGTFTHLSFSGYENCNHFIASRTTQNKLAFWDDNWNGFIYNPPFSVWHTEDGLNWAGTQFNGNYGSSPQDFYYIDGDAHLYLSIFHNSLGTNTYPYGLDEVQFLKSGDNGATWTPSGVGPIAVFPGGIGHASVRYRMPGSFKLYVLDVMTETGPIYTTNLYTSNNELESLTQIATFPGVQMQGQLIVSPDESKMVVYFYSFFDNITHFWRSLDGGLSWSMHNTGINLGLLRFVSNTELFAPGHYSVDFGDSWISMAGTPPVTNWIPNNA